MLERRPVLIVFIGLMLCISLWRISWQDSPIITEYASYEAIDIPSANSNNETRSSIALNAVPLPTTQLDLLSKEDANTLIDLNDFDYLINQVACDDPIIATNSVTVKPFILVLIHSAPKNWHKRNVIRETWGQYDARVRFFFLLGSVNSSLLQSRLQQENYMFRDIIQGNFVDAYRNMTYKHIMAFKWFIYNCPKLKYLLKTDDDVFVNTPAVYDFLAGPASNDRNLLFCFRNERAPVKRTYRSKWRVSTKEYPGWYYPPYCPGFSIIYSADVVFQLYKIAQRTPYFWIDDIHVTGTLAQHINLNITALGNYYMDGETRDSIFNGKSNLMEMEPMFLFTQPNLVEKQIRKLWKIILLKNR